MPLSPESPSRSAGTAEPVGAGARAGGYYTVLALVLAAVIVPMWMVRFPGMIDYPSHLVRCYIIAHFGANPLWRHFYRIQFGPIPNLAMDAVVAPLASWLPIILSGRIFLTVLAGLYVIGCSVLAQVAWGRRSWLAPLAGLTLYNSTLLWGFVNYLFGLGLFFLVFALWLRQRRSMNVRWFAVLAGLSVVVYLAHLGAVAVLGVACVTVALMDFAGEWRWGRLLAQTGWLGLPVAILGFGYLGRNGRVGQITWSSPLHKLVALAALVRSYNLRSDAAIAVGLALCALVLLRRCHWQRELAAAGVVLLACCLVMPYQVMTAKNVDMRISIPALVLLVLALRPHWGRAQKMALTAALLLMGLHAGLIARHWTGMNRREDRVLALGAKLVPGTRIDVIEDTPGGVVTNKWDFTLPKIVDYWSVSRGTYESNVFAEAGQQPLIKRRGFSNCWPAGQAACLHNFDYIVTVNAPQPLARGVRAIATPVAQAEGATLWRVKQGLGFGG